MTARAQALPWFEDDGPRELARWSLAAAVVVGVHVALIGGYMLWQPATEDVGDDTDAIAIELTVQRDEQQEQAKVDQPPPPEQTTTDVTLPEEKPPEKVEPTNPAPFNATKEQAAAPRIDPRWLTSLIKQLQRFKTYPGGAQARKEEGVVRLAFTVDRNGHVLSRQIATSSGYPDLDAEALTMLERAQPLPAFPASMTQEQRTFDVPVHFTLR
jgi:protein TonB